MPDGDDKDTPTCGGVNMPSEPGGVGVGKWVCINGEWKWKEAV